MVVLWLAALCLWPQHICNDIQYNSTPSCVVMLNCTSVLTKEEEIKWRMSRLIESVHLTRFWYFVFPYLICIYLLFLLPCKFFSFWDVMLTCMYVVMLLLFQKRHSCSSKPRVEWSSWLTKMNMKVEQTTVLSNQHKMHVSTSRNQHIKGDYGWSRVRVQCCVYEINPNLVSNQF